MNFSADGPLTKDEFASLKEVSIGLLAKRIPEVHYDKLIEMDFIEQKIGGPVLTDKGKLRLTRGE